MRQVFLSKCGIVFWEVVVVKHKMASHCIMSGIKVCIYRSGWMDHKTD